MRAYLPSNRIPRNGFILFLMIVLVGGTTLAIFVGESSYFAAYHTGFRDSVRSAYLARERQLPSESQLDEEIDRVLYSEVGSTGYEGYFQWVAKQGIKSQKIDFSGARYGIYILIEILATSGFAAIHAFQQANKPFDEAANQWYGRPKFLGSIDGIYQFKMNKALKSRNFHELGKLMTPDRDGIPRYDFSFSRSSEKSVPKDVYLIVKSRYRSQRGLRLGVTTAIVEEGFISATALQRMDQAMLAQMEWGKAKKKRWGF